MFCRSKNILDRPNNSMHRSLFKSMGYTDRDLDKPLIGIANSWNNICPGSKNLRNIGEAVEKGILEAGGTPVEFGVPAACDGIANGHEGMHYILPTREVIANSTELMIQAHRLDAVVLLGSCDKIVPGMLMAAARLDIPAILVPGGPMKGGVYFNERKSDVTTLTEALGMLKTGKISEKEFYDLEDKVAPGPGSCAFLGTANTMCSLSEAMGMTVPGGGTAPTTTSKRLRLAQKSGRAVMNLVKEGITAREVINEQSIKNAMKVNTAIGGSTNAVLHLLAIAYEAEADISIELFDEISRKIPYIAKIYPSGPANVPDFDKAGGVTAVMKEISSLLNLEVMTVTGEKVREFISSARVDNREIIKTMESPFENEGGVAILSGNLAPDTAVVKPSAIDPSIRTFTGQARVFDSEQAANEAISSGEIKEGDVIVIRYEGPKGGPGMREMYKSMKLLYGMGLGLKTALITDGRFSGTNNGCFVGHISPEASEGGPIAIVEEGDKITIDIPNRDLKLHVSEEEINSRLGNWEKPEKKIKNGYLSLYSRLATSANTGAIIKYREE